MNPPSTTLKGKLVVTGWCGFNAVQVIGGNIDSSKIQKTWEFNAGGKDTVFANVFRIANNCAFDTLLLSRNDTFSFQLSDTLYQQTCEYCMIAWPGGLNVANTIINVQRQ